MPNLKDLIARVEAGEGADRALDMDVFEFLGLAPIVGDGPYDWKRCAEGIYRKADWSTWGESKIVPHFTSSVDVSMALLPEGQGCQLQRYWIASVDGPVWSAYVTYPSKRPEVIVGSDHAEAWDCRNPARALLAAILRAKEDTDA